MDPQADFLANVCDRLHALEKACDELRRDRRDVEAKYATLKESIRSANDNGTAEIVAILVKKLTPERLARCRGMPFDVYHGATIWHETKLDEEYASCLRAVRVVERDLPDWICLRVHCHRAPAHKYPNVRIEVLFFC